MEKYRLVGERKGGGGGGGGRHRLTADAAKTGGAAVATTTTDEGGGGGGGESSSSSPSEVRITQQGKPRNYITYAMSLFQEDDHNEITLKAMGRAINKAVTIAEILKRKMPLHQITSLSSIEIVDVFEPLEEGLDVVESRRHVSCAAIRLSRDGEGMDRDDIGYQPPLPPEEMHPGDLNTRGGGMRGSKGGGGGGASTASGRGPGGGGGGPTPPMKGPPPGVVST